MGGPLRKYRVTVNGTEAVLKLNEKDAEAYGDLAVPVEDGTADGRGTPAVPNKRRSPANKSRVAGDTRE